MSWEALISVKPIVSAVVLMLAAVCGEASADQVIRLTPGPFDPLPAEAHVVSGVPSLGAGLHFNAFLGADRFYSAGITGQGTTSTVVDAGHIWNQHITLTHVNQFITGTGALGEVDRHATAVGMVLGGRKNPNNRRDFQSGIAMDTVLRSAAVAVSWSPASPETPRYSDKSNTSLTSFFSAYQAAFGTSDVINQSFGLVSPAGNHPQAIGVDGLARANPQTTVVASAGNNGPGPNSVTGVAAGYNSIAVATPVLDRCMSRYR